VAKTRLTYIILMYIKFGFISNWFYVTLQFTHQCSAGAGNTLTQEHVIIYPNTAHRSVNVMLNQKDIQKIEITSLRAYITSIL